jgi:hypothetical protein
MIERNFPFSVSSPAPHGCGDKVRLTAPDDEVVQRGGNGRSPAAFHDYGRKACRRHGRAGRTSGIGMEHLPIGMGAGNGTAPGRSASAPGEETGGKAQPSGLFGGKARSKSPASAGFQFRRKGLYAAEAALGIDMEAASHSRTFFLPPQAVPAGNALRKQCGKGLGLLVFLLLFLAALGVEVYLIGFRKGAAETADGTAEAAADLRQALGAEYHEAENEYEQDLLRSKTEHIGPPKTILDD